MTRYDETYLELISKLNSAFDKKKEENRADLHAFDKINMESQKFIEDLPYEEIRKIALKVRFNVTEIGYLTDKEKFLIKHIKDGRRTNCKQVVYRLRGKIDTELIMKRYVDIFKSETAFRTYYLYKGLREPVKVVCENREKVFPIRDIRALSTDKKTFLIKNILVAQMRREHNIESDPVFQLQGFMIGEEDLMVIVSIYPYVAYSIGARGIIYKIFEGMEMDSFNIPVVDEKTAMRMNEELKNKSMAYWKNMLLPLGKSMTIPGEHKKNERNSIKAGKTSLYKELSGELVQYIKEFCKKNNTTVKVLFLYAWGSLMGKYHNEENPLMLTINKGEKLNLFPVKITRGQSLEDNLQNIDKQLVEGVKYTNCTIQDIETLCEVSFAEYFRMLHNFIEFSELDDIGSGKDDIVTISGMSAYDTDINLFISYYLYDNSIGINYLSKSGIVELVLDNLHEFFVKELSLMMTQQTQKFDKNFFISVSDTDEERMYKLKVAQIALYLKESGIFETFTVDEIMKLAGACSLDTYLSNDAVVSEKSKVSELYILGDGQIEESMTALDGIVKTLRIIKKGSVFGVESIISDSEAKTTYEVVSKQAKVVKIDKEIIEEVFKRKPDGLKRLLENEMNQKSKLQRLWTME